MRPPQLACPRCARSPGRCDCTPGLGPCGRPWGPLAVQAAVEVSGLPATLRHLLMVVARRATGCWGVWWGAAATLGELCGVTDRTVRRSLAELVAGGVLTAEERSGDTTLYRIRLDWVAAALAGDLEVETADELEPPSPDPSPAPATVEGSARNTGGADRRSGRIVDPGRIQDQGGADRRSADQGIDPPRSAPPPNPPPRAEGGSTRERWVADRALGELGSVGDVVTALQRYERGDRGLVQLWLSWSRDGTWPDAPDGLRGREVRRGLRAAAQRWRAGDSAPPPPPPAQLSLPEPADEVSLEDLARAELGDLAALVDGELLQDLVADRVRELRAAGSQAGGRDELAEPVYHSATSR